MKKKLIISTLALTLALSVVSCGDSNSEEGQATANVSESGEVTEGTENLNTNPDDIRALDFYSVEVSADETSIQPFDTILEEKEFTQLDAPVKGDLVAIVKTNKGDIKIKFLPEIAPKAVKNFVEHSLNDYFDGLTFHRVVEDFVAQSGDPTATGTGGESIWGVDFVNEINTNARHFAGAVAMANNSNNVSNGSQFYFVDNVAVNEQMIAEFDSLAADPEQWIDEANGIKAGDLFPAEVIDAYKEIGGTPFLDFGYTVFAQTYEGLDVIDAITAVERDANDKPVEDVIIEDIIIGIVE